MTKEECEELDIEYEKYLELAPYFNDLEIIEMETHGTLYGDPLH